MATSHGKKDSGSGCSLKYSARGPIGRRMPAAMIGRVVASTARLAFDEGRPGCGSCTISLREQIRQTSPTGTGLLRHGVRAEHPPHEDKVVMSKTELIGPKIMNQPMSPGFIWGFLTRSCRRCRAGWRSRDVVQEVLHQQLEVEASAGTAGRHWPRGPRTRCRSWNWPSCGCT